MNSTIIGAIVRNVVSPLITGLGRMVGGGLIAIGATEPNANAVVLGLTALGAIAVDLVVRYYERKP